MNTLDYTELRSYTIACRVATWLTFFVPTAWGFQPWIYAIAFILLGGLELRLGSEDQREDTYASDALCCKGQSSQRNSLLQVEMIEDKYVGLLLAITSSFAIGSSYVITKKGLQDASERHGFEGDGHQYFKSPIWWAGVFTMGVGEVANFAAYAFAPAILVTPLGALSVLSGAVLGAYFLNERLGKLGKMGCFICLLGSAIIALHAPPDKPVETVDEILDYAIKPGQSYFHV